MTTVAFRIHFNPRRENNHRPQESQRGVQLVVHSEQVGSVFPERLQNQGEIWSEEARHLQQVFQGSTSAHRWFTGKRTQLGPGSQESDAWGERKHVDEN